MPRSYSPRGTEVDTQFRGNVRDAAALQPPKQRRVDAGTATVALLKSDSSGHVGDQDVSAQIAQPSDALGATDPLAQRTLPRSASKHPDCRSRAGAGVDHADHIAARVGTPPAAAWSRARLLGCRLCRRDGRASAFESARAEVEAVDRRREPPTDPLVREGSYVKQTVVGTALGSCRRW